jgi:phage host-nuclease inhibitor protein Gam
MDIKIVGDNGVVNGEPVEKKVEAPETTIIPEGVLLLEQVAQLFDFKPSEVQAYKTELNTLLEYAKLKTDDKSAEGLKWAIRNLSLKVGTPPIGEKMIKYLTRYAYLYLEGKKIDKEKENFLKGEKDDN